ncbi:MAG: thermonuclease family protein [Oceanospirillaceae bacterium]|nr:thermonuclease family protein [Oceanospirillaceae bacterium]
MPKGEGAQAEVERVLDGDTLVLRDGRTVRLIGINTPELGRDGRADEAFAREARLELRRLATPGSRLFIYPGREGRDRYGRTLAHLVDDDGRLLAESLLADGLGYALAIAPNTTLADCLFSLERTARERQVGLWKLSPVKRLERGAALKAGFGVWRGRVTRTGLRKDGAWLVLDEQLFVLLPGSFRARVGTLRDRTVEARGWLVDRGRRSGAKDGTRQRWLLSISHPLHLVVMD